MEKRIVMLTDREIFALWTALNKQQDYFDPRIYTGALRHTLYKAMGAQTASKLRAHHRTDL